MADIVDDFLQRLQQHIPDAPPEIRHQIETGLRHAWGGNEVYVGKRLSRSTRISLVARGLQHRQPLAEVFAQAGIGRRQGYYLLKTK